MSIRQCLLLWKQKWKFIQESRGFITSVAKNCKKGLKITEQLFLSLSGLDWNWICVMGLGVPQSHNVPSHRFFAVAE